MKKITRALPLALFAGLLAGCGGGGGGGVITPPVGGGGGGGGGLLSWTRAANPASASEPAAEAPFTAPDGTVFFGNQDGLFSTTNRGQSWNRVSVGAAGTTAQSLGVNASGELLAGVGQQAYRQTGGSWQQSTGITSTLKVSGFTIDSTGAVVAVTAWTGDVWRSTDNGASYTKIAINPGTTGALWVIKKGPDGTLYTGGELTAGIFRSTDNGATWQQFGLSSAEGYSGNLRGISFNRLGEVLANRLLSGQPIQRYSGGNWVVASSGIPNGDQATEIVMSSSGRLYTGTFRSRGSGTFTGKVYVSSDDGQSWSAAANGLPDVGISRLALTRDGYLIAGCADGSVYRSNSPVP